MTVTNKALNIIHMQTYVNLNNSVKLNETLIGLSISVPVSDTEPVQG